MKFPETLSCPVPVLNHKTIQLAHGAGGRLSSELIEKVFLPRFGNSYLNRLEDQAQVASREGRLAFTTDSFVVDPIFFPGGNIGDLAINGTVNDLAMSGAVPEFISVGFILEEGLSIEELHVIALSMEKAAKTAGVKIVTGDTKVVNKGSCDKIFINTSGIGWIPDDVMTGSERIKIGDKIILSGTVADHGMAVLTSREGLSFQSRVKSDSQALNGLVQTMLEVCKNIRVMRDPTRGGVATTLNEFVKNASFGMLVEEDEIPVLEDVRSACEVLGIDPLYVANEGKLIAVVPGDDADAILKALQEHPFGERARIIGNVVKDNPGIVGIKNSLGVTRILDMPVGEQLPRIC